MQGPDLKKRVREIMTTRIVAATRKYNARDLAVLLQSGTFSGVPIIDPGNILVGMVTEFDLLNALAEEKDLHKTLAEDIMSIGPLSVEESATVGEVIHLMMEHKVIRLPVVRDRKLIGLISRTDILDHLIDSHIVNVYGT